MISTGSKSVDAILGGRIIVVLEQQLYQLHTITGGIMSQSISEGTFPFIVLPPLYLLDVYALSLWRIPHWENPTSTYHERSGPITF